MSSAIPSRAPQPAVVTDAVVKRYRLYSKPVSRFLDLFGLCPASPDYFTEHTALNNVTLSIGRGEKVAIIGRNGAGKSTLLKIVTGLVRPTSGSVRVNGKVSNLLQIGSGFHPDFTGRQNVFAGLAHQGIIGREAERLFNEVAAFAEIGEYIDQPMKTFSTGMCSRLMFSSSIVVSPDILIVDEILGVGDAYFSHKSFERMRELCSRGGTTLLLVTHDIYSAQNLCDRFIWLDRGEVKFDGDGKSAVSLYESSVKEQEEHWLRQRNAALLAPSETDTVVHVLARSRTGFALTAPLALGRVDLVLDDGSRRTLRVADGAAEWSLLPEGNLGPAETFGGERSRVLRSRGSIYHKAEWMVSIPARARLVRVELRYAYAGSEAVDIRVFRPDRTLLAAGELASSNGWQEASIPPAEPRQLDASKQSDYGSGLVRIVRVQFLDASGRETAEVRHGDPFTIRVGLEITANLANRAATFIVAFARHESPYSAYVYEPSLALPPSDDCTVELRLDSVQLGSGRWYVSVGIGEPGLYDRPSIQYFTVDTAWYHMLAARLELSVTSATRVDALGCFFIHPATIALTAESPQPSAKLTHST